MGAALAWPLEDSMRAASAGAELATRTPTDVDRVHRRVPRSVIRPELLEEGKSH